MKIKMPSSYDVIGSKEKAVAIVEISDKFKGKEKKIAEEILKRHKNVKSVLKKLSSRKGIFRTREYELLLGDKNTEVIHIEHGYRLKLDPRKVYFSSREGTERQRSANEVKSGEIILVMFSGIASFPIAIARKQPKVGKIVAVEINQEANKYALENVRINKVSHKIIPINGDVKIVVPNLDTYFDRIIMPLPLEAYKFLELAVKYLKAKGIIDLYFIGKSPDFFLEKEDLIKLTVDKLGKNMKILDKRLILPYGPRFFKCLLEIFIY